MKVKNPHLFVLALIALTWIPAGHAGFIVTVNWSGTVTEVPSTTPSLIDELITGSFSFDSSSPESGTNISNATGYDTAHVSSYSVGGLAGTFSGQEIIVSDGGFSDGSDAVRSSSGDNVSYTGSLFNGLTPESFVIDIRDTEGDAISNESLPTVLNPSDWDLDPGTFDGQISFAEFGVGVLRFDLDSFTSTSVSAIPEPSSLALVIVGLAGIGWARERMRPRRV